MSLHMVIYHHIPEHVEFYECDMMEYDRGDTTESDLLHKNTHIKCEQRYHIKFCLKIQLPNLWIFWAKLNEIIMN